MAHRMSLGELARIAGISRYELDRLVKYRMVRPERPEGRHPYVTLEEAARFLALRYNRNAIAVYAAHRVTGYAEKDEVARALRLLGFRPVLWCEEPEVEQVLPLPRRKAFRELAVAAGRRQIGGFVSITPGLVPKHSYEWLELSGLLGLRYYGLLEGLPDQPRLVHEGGNGPAILV